MDILVSQSLSFEKCLNSIKVQIKTVKACGKMPRAKRLLLLRFQKSSAVK
jgi:hypothetical protein